MGEPEQLADGELWTSSVSTTALIVVVLVSFAVLFLLALNLVLIAMCACRHQRNRHRHKPGIGIVCNLYTSELYLLTPVSGRGAYQRVSRVLSSSNESHDMLVVCV